MRICYDKLWHLLKLNKMSKADLADAANLTSYTMCKLYNDKAVSLDIMARICTIFHCDIGDVMEMIED